MRKLTQCFDSRYSHQVKEHPGRKRSERAHNRQWKGNVTGVKAFALGLGLKDEALTFNRLAAVLGDMGGAAAEAFNPEPDGVFAAADPLPLAGVALPAFVEFED